MENMFSNTGLTSSEANHITNVTKELVKDIKFVVIPSFDVNRNNPGIILGLEITK